ncbi:MAG: hydantoinase/oxoprolinase family protein [Candidatus Undinarchaeales archaeon]|jgi:hypothetical protein|nr:hydantoinase/oxoprolinase family protein [Candidatus Undinarchaeales archaeon]MDP7493305.1 hydantoinase/oxoprolinase family protein [Candidatus Undinarchaeales archaeon]
MASYVGIDIGGANTKVAVLSFGPDGAETISTSCTYFPVWQRRDELASMLRGVVSSLPTDVLGIGVTMTCELSDTYETKAEGVSHVLDCIDEVARDTEVRVLDVSGHLLDTTRARKAPVAVAAANWYASAFLAAKRFPDALLLDTGSTSTDIIPIIDGIVAPKGGTDLERLGTGELVYTGLLRTNLAAVSQFAEIGGIRYGVSSELFAQSADVHLVLENIDEERYTCDTLDGRGVTVPEAMARICRVVCADMTQLSTDDIRELSRFFADRQIEAVRNGIATVCAGIRSTPPLAIVAGIGAEALARPAAVRAGIGCVRSFSQAFGDGSGDVAPSVGLAHMVREDLLA